MIEETEFETFLSVSSKEFGIYLFDTKNYKNLYKQEVKFEIENQIIDFEYLSIFLEKNIFKIEKKIGKFIKNLSLIIETNKTNNINLSIKKKIYEKTVKKKILENLLTDAKDLFNENYQDQKIMHILINRYLINSNEVKNFEEGINADSLSIEIQFKSIPSIFLIEIEKILEKYQIKIDECLDGAYVKNFFNYEKLEVSVMAFKIQNGLNSNEVKLIQKSAKKLGFFEKFFQLFS